MRVSCVNGRKSCIAIIASTAVLAGCDPPSKPVPTIIGKWFNNEKNAVIEFKRGGVFNFSNAGILTLGAEWLIVEKGRVRIQVIGLGAPPPEVCNFDINADTLRFSGCTMPPTWKRVP